MTSVDAGSRPERDTRAPRAPAPRAQALVLFGATGDLARRKIFPALYRMEARGALGVPVVGVARSEDSQETFRGRVRDAVERFVPQRDPAVLDRLLERVGWWWRSRSAATWPARRS